MCLITKRNRLRFDVITKPEPKRYISGRFEFFRSGLEFSVLENDADADFTRYSYVSKNHATSIAPWKTTSTDAESIASVEDAVKLFPAAAADGKSPPEPDSSVVCWCDEEIGSWIQYVLDRVWSMVFLSVASFGLYEAHRELVNLGIFFSTLVVLLLLCVQQLLGVLHQHNIAVLEPLVYMIVHKAGLSANTERWLCSKAFKAANRTKSSHENLFS